MSTHRSGSTLIEYALLTGGLGLAVAVVLRLVAMLLELYTSAAGVVAHAATLPH